MAHPRVSADLVLKSLGITECGDLEFLEEIAWQRGALVRDAPMSGAEARLTVNGTRGIITVSNSVPHRRRRFSIAHELGHFEMHKVESALEICLDEDIERPLSARKRNAVKLREVEANEFASHLLIPDRFAIAVTKGKPPSLELVQQVSETFDVSMMAAGIAYMRICKEACALVYSQNGYTKWCQRSKDLEETGLWISLGPIDNYAIASAFFRGRPMQKSAGRVEARCWLEPGSFREDGTILEQSVGIPSLDAVVSLLWMDQDIAYEDEEA